MANYGEFRIAVEADAGTLNHPEMSDVKRGPAIFLLAALLIVAVSCGSGDASNTGAEQKSMTRTKEKPVTRTELLESFRNYSVPLVLTLDYTAFERFPESASLLQGARESEDASKSCSATT